MAIQLLDLLLIGIPEVVLCTIVGLVTCRGNVKKNLPLFFMKLTLSVVIVLNIIYASRQVLTSTALITISTTITYLLIFKLLWDMNWRQSTLASLITMFVLLGIETAMLPIYTQFRTKFGDDSFFGSALGFSPFLRLIHFLAFMFFTKFNLRNSKALACKWEFLNGTYKAIAILIILSVALCFAFNINYSSMYVKTVLNNINVSGIAFNLNVFFWGNVLFF